MGEEKANLSEQEIVLCTRIAQSLIESSRPGEGGVIGPRGILAPSDLVTCSFIIFLRQR